MLQDGINKVAKRESKIRY